MKKPTLRLFADYACSIPLWEDGKEYKYGEILDGSQEQLIEMGVSKTTLALMESLCFVFESGSNVGLDEYYNSTWEEGAEDTYKYLITSIKKRLDYEIGHKFSIEIVW